LNLQAQHHFPLSWPRRKTTFADPELLIIQTATMPNATDEPVPFRPLSEAQEACLNQLEGLLLALAPLLGEAQNLLAAICNVINPRTYPEVMLFLFLTLLSSLNKLLKLAANFAPLCVVLILNSFEPRMLAASLPPS
jgi:hypothetical protein